MSVFKVCYCILDTCWVCKVSSYWDELNLVCSCVCLRADFTHGVIVFIQHYICLFVYCKTWFWGIFNENLSDGSMCCFWQYRAFLCFIIFWCCQWLFKVVSWRESLQCCHILRTNFHITCISQLHHCSPSVLWLLSIAKMSWITTIWCDMQPCSTWCHLIACCSVINLWYDLGYWSLDIFGVLVATSAIIFVMYGLPFSCLMSSIICLWAFAWTVWLDWCWQENKWCCILSCSLQIGYLCCLAGSLDGCWLEAIHEWT